MEWKNTFFEILTDLYSEDAEITREEIDGRDTLNIVFGVEDGEESLYIECSVDVNVDEDAGIARIQLFFIVKDDIPAEKKNDIYRLIAMFNSTLSLGFFGLMEEEGVLYFNCAFDVLAGDSEESFRSVLRTFTNMYDTAFYGVIEALEYVCDYLSGNVSLDELIADDISITQDYEPGEE